jgi:hypothetical protein
MSSENSLSFFGAGGHSHNGVNSTLIDTTRYSIFDFSLGFVGSQARINSQSVKQRSFEDYVIRIINSQVLQPAGLSLDPDTLNGKTIRANTITSTEIQARTITSEEIRTATITANELTSNIVLVNNIIRSNNFDGTFHANGVINSTGTTGWGISYAGSSVFNSATIRGRLTAGDIYIPSVTSPVFSVTSSGALTATSGRIGPFDMTDTSFRSTGYSPRNYMTIENYGDITVYSNPNSGVHNNMIHTTSIVGEYVLTQRTDVTGRYAIMGSPGGNPNGMEFSLTDANVTKFIAKTDGTVVATGQITGGSFSTAGLITADRMDVNDFVDAYIFTGVTANINSGIEEFATVAIRRVYADVDDKRFISFQRGTTEVGSISFAAEQNNKIAFNSTSDRRLKENIKPIENALDTVLKIEPVSFFFKSGGNENHGFIAQDVYEVYDKIVTKPLKEEDIWMVDYTGMVPILTAAIKELSNKITELEKKFFELEKEI